MPPLQCIPTSGKPTYGFDRFWYGTQGRAERGLESPSRLGEIAPRILPTASVCSRRHLLMRLSLTKYGAMPLWRGSPGA